MKRFAPIPLAVLAAALMAGSLGPAHANVPVPAEQAASNIDAQLEQISREVTATDRRLEQLRGQLDIVRRRMNARSRAHYKLVHAGMLPVSSGFEALMSHTAKVERIRRALEGDVLAAKQLEGLHQALTNRRRQLLERKVPLEMQQKAMQQARVALLEAEDRKRAFERAFGDSVEPDYLAVYGASAPTAGLTAPDNMALEGFASFMGRLPLPLAGRAEVRLVHRRGASGPGVEMMAASGTAVRAVYPGRVAFADEYDTYGRVVIIDHGDSYFSVSGNLSEIVVRVGDDVSNGSRIGTIAATDGGRAKLYFELRRGAETLDPAPWLGL